MTNTTSDGETFIASRFTSGFSPLAPENISPLTVWLGSAAAAEVTGRIFNVHGGYISVAEGWRAGPSVDKKAQWEVAELSSVIPDLVARAGPTTLSGPGLALRQTLPDGTPVPAVPAAPAGALTDLAASGQVVANAVTPTVRPSTRTSKAPSATRFSVVARPMPVPPPDTTAILPSSARVMGYILKTSDMGVAVCIYIERLSTPFVA